MDLRKKAKNYSCTARPTKYDFINFGLWGYIEASFLENIIRDRDKNTPEFQRANDNNPVILPMRTFDVCERVGV